MTTAFLILAAVLVLAAFVCVVGQMCNCGFSWMWHAMAGTPAALCNLFCFLLSAVLEVNKD